MQPKCQHQACSRNPARLRLRPTRGAPNAAIGETGLGDHKGRPYTRTARRRGRRRGDPRGRPSRDPCGRPSRIRHGFVSFVRGGIPRHCGVPYRPERGHRGNRHGRTARPTGAIASPLRRNLAARKTWLNCQDFAVSRTLVRLAARARLGYEPFERLGYEPFECLGRRAVQERCPPVFVCNPGVNIRRAQGF